MRIALARDVGNDNDEVPSTLLSSLGINGEGNPALALLSEALRFFGMRDRSFLVLEHRILR